MSSAPARELALEHTLGGPSDKVDPARWPARGDLAHIRLAGKVFVPHYAVPMAWVVDLPATLLTAPRDDAEVRDDLRAGAAFNVLDLAGKWAWGQVGDDGCVGYVPVAALRRA